MPTRIFHWGLALSVFLSMFIVYGKKYLALHLVAGTLTFALLIGRVIWGFIGTRYVRFGAFAKSLDEVKREFDFFGKKDTHSVGHPAIAGLVMLILIFCGLCVGASGLWLWLFVDVTSKESALYIHEVFANTLLVIAFVHIQGVALHTLLHKDGIAYGMVNGKRPALAGEQIERLSLFQKTIAALWFLGSSAAALMAIRI